MNGVPMEKARSRSRFSVLFVSLLTIVGSVTVMAQPSFGIGEPSVQFLNPSSYATAGERGIIVSDAAPTAGPGWQEGARRGYRLSAWVANAPPGSRVFFSLVQRNIDIEITDTRASADGSAWETDWRIPDRVVDGPATFRAHLVLNDTEVAADRVDVTILRLQDSARIVYPEVDGQFGMYSPLADALPEGQAPAPTPPVGVVDAHYYIDNPSNSMRVFYTTSARGSEPEWKICGEDFLDLDDGIQCDLVSPDDRGKVTAVAVVTNDGTTVTWEDRNNQSGDAVAIGAVYEQTPTEFGLVTEGSQSIVRDVPTSPFGCSDVETVKLTDQFGRQIAGANIDVHATGPTDALQFDHDSLEVWSETTAADRGHSLENAYDCMSHPANSDPGEQGDHNRFGAPDRKHVEIQASGTDKLGTFDFSLRSTDEGLTEWTAWVDEADDGCGANDDLFTSGELFISGSIGWDRSAETPTDQPYDTAVPCAGTPLPEPTATDGPAEEFDGSRSVSLRIAGSPEVGSRARFGGRVDAVEPACAENQTVILKGRRPGQKYWTLARGRTDDTGRFFLRARVRAPRDYRVVAPATPRCTRAASQPLKLRK